jgi:c-di-GMP-binding flagellar brake protein YcgR
MFESGRVYKVKIESSPGEIGFARATILDKAGNQLCIQIKTSKESNKILPKGTRIWFVSDSTDNTFNGLWSSAVVGAQISGGKTSLLCSAPKLEPLLQRRRTPRVNLDVPVRVSSLNGDTVSSEIRSVDISRSGIALETSQTLPDNVGQELAIVVEASVGEIPAVCRVIRIEKNWLAHKSVIGLEFTELTDDAVATLDNLLVLLGGKPRHAEAASAIAETGKAMRPTKTGLAAWIGTQPENIPKSRFIGASEGTGEENQTQPGSQRPQAEEKAEESSDDK